MTHDSIQQRRRGRSRPAGRSGALVSLLLGLVMAAGAASAASVQVTVANVRQATGHVRVALCTRATFLKSGCPYNASAPALAGETVVTVADVAPGQYAAQVFDDDLDSGKVHQDKLGVPREGIGFSNNAALHLHGPRFEEAAFDVPEDGAQIHLKLRYLSASNWTPPSGAADKSGDASSAAPESQ